MSGFPLTFQHSAFVGLMGVGREDITPPVGIYARNWGAAEHDVAEGIHRPLTATALTLQQRAGDSPCVLIVLDLGWWRAGEDERRLRARLLEALALDPARLLVGCTHTHAGPILSRQLADKPGGDLIGPYLDRLEEATLAAVQSALQSRAPAVLTWAQGRCNLAQNRDLRDPEGNRFLCGFNPGAPADDTLLVGRVTGERGEVLATLVNYACHPTTLAWQNRLISPDFVGAMRAVIESQTGGAPCLFLQGASGELAPREQYTDDVRVADANGRQLGYAALATLEGMLPPCSRLAYEGVVESGAPLAVWSRQSWEPSPLLATMQTEVEYDLALRPLAEIEAQHRRCADRALAERLERERDKRRALGEGSSVRLPLWLWRIGDALLIAHPNEAYSLLQTELRRRFPGRTIVVMNLANGAYAYLPPAHLYGQDLYQVWQTPFAQGSLERLLETCQEGVESLLAGPGDSD